jgi:hypothetical protein
LGEVDCTFDLESGCAPLVARFDPVVAIFGSWPAARVGNTYTPQWFGALYLVFEPPFKKTQVQQHV